MVRAADQVKAVLAEGLGLQLGRVRADGGQREVGLARGHALDARLGQHVGNVQFHARVLCAKAGQHTRQPPCGQRGQQRDGHAPAPQQCGVAQRGQRGIHLGANAQRRRMEVLALGRQAHMARAAVEQAQTQVVLQRADERAEGRLRQVALRRGAREAALRRQGKEGVDLPCGDIHLISR